MRFLLLAVALLMLPACGKAQEAPRDFYTEVGPDDPDMNAAIAEARRTLPEFWRRMEHPEPGTDSFVLKVGMKTPGGGTEHIWVYDVRRNGDVITARLGDEPYHLPGKKIDDPVTFRAEDISDWGYSKGGKMYGNFTTRVLMTKGTKEEAEQLRALLSPTPLEPAPS